jgi:DegV family protein with EDD domain
LPADACTPGQAVTAVPTGPEGEEPPGTSDIAIVTDSSCDLSAEALRTHEISVVPQIVRFGAEVFRDGDLPVDRFWTKVGQSASPPQTSQPSVGSFQETFGRLLDAKEQVLCLALAAQYSGTYSAACTAAQSYPGRVIVIDSQSLSLGQGYQALVASRAAQDGAAMQEIVQRLRGVQARTRLFIGLDTIDFVARGGRLAHLVPIVRRLARAVRIRPLLEMSAGEIHLMGVARSRSKLVQRIRDEVARNHPLEMLLVAHTRLAEGATSLAEELARIADLSPEQILVAEAGPTLACHAGPGMIASGIVSCEP